MILLFSRPAPYIAVFAGLIIGPLLWADTATTSGAGATPSLSLSSSSADSAGGSTPAGAPASAYSDLWLRQAPMGPSSPIPSPAAPFASPSPGTPPELSSVSDPDDLPDHLLVVYNQNDPESGSLANYYALQRNVPSERVLAISCPTTEEITRAQYDDSIRAPILSYLIRKNWMTRQPAQMEINNRLRQVVIAGRNDIWAMVLIRGVPLKIAHDPDIVDGMQAQPELQSNAAAVDSELALLPVFGLPKGGYVPNVFFDGTMTGSKRVGSELARHLILVTRLDGPTADDVRRMIDDTMYAEKNRLAGLAVIDSRGLTDVKGAYTAGDVWLRNARTLLVQNGWTVKFDDKSDVLPATDASNQVALYLGWYTGNAAGPWITSPNRFVRGAIAYHLHSYSASTVRSSTSNWAGPLIAHGAAATMGSVYEPYLILTPHEDIFTKHLLDGNYFAEAAYASEVGLSWMITVIGDPLYRPFRTPLDSALANGSDPHSDHDDWLFLQQIQHRIFAGELPGTGDVLETHIDVAAAGAVAHEVLGDLLEKINDPSSVSAAEQAFRKALDGYTLPIDRIRVGLKLAQHYSNHANGTRALSQLDVLRELYPEDAKKFGVPDQLVPTTSLPDPPFPAQRPSTPTSGTPSPATPAGPTRMSLPALPQQRSGPE